MRPKAPKQFWETLPRLKDTTYEVELARLEAHKLLRPEYKKPLPPMGSPAWKTWAEAHRKWLAEHEVLQARMSGFGLTCTKGED